ncbi:MAG TPA: alpha/beta hydrolase [Microscillaceae bacterium]|nr:alpha/beta hydrolase [Microscillaceae bacterium]
MDKLLAYEISGTGPSVVLLHGFCENRTMWRHIVPHLASHYQVLTIDLGGFGESAHLLPKSASVAALAQQVQQLLHHLHISKTIVLGHSLGGYVALALAQINPLLCQGIGLIHSSAAADSKARKNMRNRVIEIVQARGVKVFAQQFVPSLFLPERHQTLKVAIKEAQQMALQTPKASVIEITKAMRDRPDQIQLLGTLECPILFLIGKQDQAITFNQYLPQITQPQDAVIHILDQTAHMGIWERPLQTQYILYNFVEYCTQTSQII